MSEGTREALLHQRDGGRAAGALRRKPRRVCLESPSAWSGQAGRERKRVKERGREEERERGRE